MKHLLAAAISLSLLALSPMTGAQMARAETAKTLGQVPSKLKTPEAKRIFEEQIEGKAAPDKLGTHLPAGLTKQEISALLLPPANTAPLNAVGAKPLPGLPDSYVAIVCTGGDVPTGPNDTPCNQYSNDSKPPLAARIGLIEMKSGAAPKLAATPLTVDGLVDWRNTDLPSAPDALEDSKSGKLAPTQYEGFDLAPYRISADTRAFGLRGTWSDSYSGGGASYSALYLFAVVDGALRQVLAVPMSAFKDIAGDWNKDGTRSHNITEDANVLIVSKHETGGYFDLLIKSRKGHGQRLYRWSAAAKAYRLLAK